jgi:hypothetical protein
MRSDSVDCDYLFFFLAASWATVGVYESSESMLGRALLGMTAASSSSSSKFNARVFSTIAVNELFLVVLVLRLLPVVFAVRVLVFTIGGGAG